MLSVASRLTSDIGIVAERPLYFSANIPAAGGATTGAASVVGTTGPGKDWLFAEGHTGTNFQEYLVLANFTYASTTAKVKLLYTNGTTQTASVTIPSLSFYNFDVNIESSPCCKTMATHSKPWMRSSSERRCGERRRYAKTFVTRSLLKRAGDRPKSELSDCDDGSSRPEERKSCYLWCTDQFKMVDSFR